jgi:hypothetical protein
MKLRDRIHEGDVVKIGFRSRQKDKNGGSGFIFCGKICDRAIEYLNRKSNQKRRENENRLKIAKANHVRFPNNEEWQAEYEYYKEAVKNWTPFLDREVIEEMPSYLNPDVSVIICDGEEKGKFWLISEFRERNEWVEGEDESAGNETVGILEATEGYDHFEDDGSD